MDVAPHNVTNKLYGAIEAGGSKWLCAVGTGPDDLRVARFQTRTPTETLSEVIDFFRQEQIKNPLEAIGIGSFGPLDLDKRSKTYGYITGTPKENWSHTDIVSPILQVLQVPVSFDTDVNTAALGEHIWGAAQGLSDFIYLTIGTGIGGGGLANGQLMHGLVHPEMGHIMLPQMPEDDYVGGCAFHQNRCFEGLASGPSMTARWHALAETFPEDHPAWILEAHYIALALVSYICTLSPQRIILGGGVMQQKQLFPLIRKNVKQLLNGYVQSSVMLTLNDYVVPPQLGDKAGLLGALALAKQCRNVTHS
jgi:fructokinase